MDLTLFVNFNLKNQIKSRKVKNYATASSPTLYNKIKSVCFRFFMMIFPSLFLWWLFHRFSEFWQILLASKRVVCGLPAIQYFVQVFTSTSSYCFVKLYCQPKYLGLFWFTRKVVFSTRIVGATKREKQFYSGNKSWSTLCIYCIQPDFLLGILHVSLFHPTDVN